ncbi:ABC transporter ATP-binding protein [Pikeienuella piscinae]|uniref:ABC transporter ATP-binding protein n=1 Tax=Pikeienuella piscinae TaxID=2748098 RepID=A0A7L5BZX8_9RHOB|nr:ABC transporter ATP-binding protein [Pikeienuella piscinae]QIE55816.1 ABC transporter ATP-binding protein [Pikeienuella piscinae]
MIELIDLSKEYRSGSIRRTIAENINLTIPRGRSLGLLGRNGAGKSTLLRMIAGTVEPDSGRIIRHATVSWPLGFAGSFHGMMTGAQNVRFVARIYGRDPDMLIAYVADFSELGEALYMPVNAYSSGMRARLAFGVSMGIDFDYYLVDETTAVGDVNFKKKCRKVFAERLAASDVIMVSHATATLIDYCKAGVVLEDGRVTYYENIADAVEAHEANMAMR